MLDMKFPKNADKILKILKDAYPDADCALSFQTPLQLLIATILSAQCTDKRVNEVTKVLFKRYKSAQDFARADPAELEDIVRSTGFFRMKAKSIRETAQKILSDFKGEVPKTMDELLTLRGVARKTANVVMGNAFGIASGIVVDTHVKRLSKRLGLSRNTDPVKVEKDLVKITPQKDWIWLSHAFISHGRALCKAQSPRCDQCPLNKICPSSEV